MTKSNVIAQLQEENQRLRAEVAALRQERAQNYSQITGAIEQEEYIESLRRSEALYKSLFEISNEGIYRWQLDEPVSLSKPISEQAEQIYQNFYIAEGNIACAQMYGFTTVEDVIGIRIANTHVADSDKNRKFVKDCVENGHCIRNAESEEIDNNGQKRYFLNSVISFIENDCVTGGWGTYIDITELRTKEQALLDSSIERERLLQTITTIANQLLRAGDYTTTLPSVLGSLGEAARADRCYLIENLVDPQTEELAIRMHTEWCNQGIAASIDITPELASSASWDNFLGVQEKLIKGEMVTLWIDELPEPSRSELKKQGNIAMKLVPILVQEKFWGVFGFDYCSSVPAFDVAHKAIFTIAVDCIAAAIERQEKDIELKQIQQAALEAEQQRATELELHNTELQQTLVQLTESEERYRALMELSSEGIYRFEYAQPISVSLPLSEQVKEIYQQSRVAEHNLAYAAQMSGYHQPNVMIGARLSDMHVMGAEENILQMSEFVRSGHRMRNQETVEIDLIGQKHHFLNNAFSIIKDGYAIGGWGTQIDITQLRQRDLLLSVVAKITKDLLKTEDLDVAIPVALEALGTATNISRILLILERFDSIEQKLKHCVAHKWVAPGIPNHHDVGMSVMDNENFEVLTQELYQGKSIWCLIDDFPEVTRSEFEKLSIKSSGVVPIFIEGRYIGNIAFDDCVTPRAWSQQEIDVLTAAAESIGAAIHRKQLVERLFLERIKAEQERVAQLQKTNDTLQHTIAKLTTTTNLSSYLENVLNIIALEWGACSNALFLYDETTGTLLQSMMMLDGTALDIENDLRMSMWRNSFNAEIVPAWHLVNQTFGIAITDIYPPHPAICEFSLPWHREMGHVSLLWAPLRISERVQGFMRLGFREKIEAITEEKIALTQTLAHQIIIVLELTRLSEEAKHEAEQSAVLEERNRMAREIHDTLAQSFTGISMQVKAAKLMAASQPETAWRLIDNVNELAISGLAEARRSVWSLHPDAAEYQEFVTALRRSLTEMTANTSINTSLEIKGTPIPLACDVGRNLLRVAQEAITNSLRHAECTSIIVEVLFNPESIKIHIQDNGCGFETAPNLDQGGFGLSSMQQRCARIGGTFELTSQIGEGTVVVIEAPQNGNG